MKDAGKLSTPTSIVLFIIALALLAYAITGPIYGALAEFSVSKPSQVEQSGDADIVVDGGGMPDDDNCNTASFCAGYQIAVCQKSGLGCVKRGLTDDCYGDHQCCCKTTSTTSTTTTSTTSISTTTTIDCGSPCVNDIDCLTCEGPNLRCDENAWGGPQCVIDDCAEYCGGKGYTYGGCMGPQMAAQCYNRGGYLNGGCGTAGMTGLTCCCETPVCGDDMLAEGSAENCDGTAGSCPTGEWCRSCQCTVTEASYQGVAGLMKSLEGPDPGTCTATGYSITDDSCNNEYCFFSVMGDDGESCTCVLDTSNCDPPDPTTPINSFGCKVAWYRGGMLPYSTAYSGTAKLEARYVTGGLAGILFEKPVPAGVHTYYWAAADQGFSSNVYLLRFYLNGNQVGGSCQIHMVK